MRRMPHDVQRDLHFYRTVVALRNAIERLQVVRGTIDDPDQVHWWWGFGYLGRPRTGLGDDDRDWDDPDDMAGSRVPRRPYGGAGTAGAELSEPVDEDEAPVTRRIPA